MFHFCFHRITTTCSYRHDLFQKSLESICINEKFLDYAIKKLFNNEKLFSNGCNLIIQIYISGYLIKDNFLFVDYLHKIYNIA